MILKGNDLFADEGYWLFEKDSVYREFTPSVTLAKPENIIYWDECEDRYKLGYKLLWKIRQEEHTEEELEKLQEQYDAWRETNPDLVEEIEEIVPIIPEPEVEPIEE